MSEFIPIIGIIVILNSPIYLMLFNIQRRLTRVETVLNGGVKKK